MLVNHKGSLWLHRDDATRTLVTETRSWEVAESSLPTFARHDGSFLSVSKYIMPVRFGQNHSKSIDDNSWNYSEASESSVRECVRTLNSSRQYYTTPSICWRVVVADLDRLTESDWTCFSELAQRAVAKNWHVLAVSARARSDRRTPGCNSHIRAVESKIHDQVVLQWFLKATCRT
jgi:hypothetical protein